MSICLKDSAWKRLYELVNDVARQKDADSMLARLESEVDELIPAEQGVVVVELIDGFPVCRRWPDYSEPLIPRFNSHFNRVCPAEYDWKRHMIGPVDWRRYSDSEYDADFNRSIDIGHTIGIGFWDRHRGREQVFALHRSRRSRGFSERDAACLNALREPLSLIYSLRRDMEQFRLRELSSLELQPGNRRLSPREAEVALLLARRMTMREIGEYLGISARTVERHALHIYQKLNLSGRRELVEAGYSARS